MRVYRLLLTTIALCVTAGTVSAGEKKVMHCFAFTSIPDAKQSDWDAFFKATDQLPSKIPSITHVWYGKLKNPLNQTQGDGSRIARDWGTCMEFSSEKALASYADDPAHKAWVDAYAKVRKEGTTTFNILGQ
jgi:hypothetical protein